MIRSVKAWSACELVAKRKKCISHYGPFYNVCYRVHEQMSGEQPGPEE